MNHIRESWNESYQRIIDTGECVICVPGVDLIDEAIRIGTTSGSKTDKFAENSLTRLPAEQVKAPLIKECLACLECRLEDVVEEHGLLIFKGIQLWENHDRKEKRCFHANGDGTFFSDGELFNRRAEMRRWVPEGCERFFKD
jgi:flavin reductase (DIM6/NTAB) family NADH-FMN oxidoreductase RutF